MRSFCIIVVVLIFSSCKNVKIISNNEDKGIKDVLNFFGGYCEYSIGASVSTNEGTKKFFELKESKSEVLEKYSYVPDVMAANVAYQFYKDLKEENKNYAEIHVVLIFQKKEKYEAVYTREQLETVSSKMNVLNKFFFLIKAQNFIGLKPLLSNDSYTEQAKSELVFNIQKVSATLGAAKDFTLFGFRFDTLNNFNVLDIYGVINSDKQNTEFTLKVDLKVSEDKAHFFDYKFQFD